MQLVKDFVPGAGSSSLHSITEANGRLFVVATTPQFGQEVWVANLAPPLPGDYDRDGVVDGADFLLWQRQLGMPATPAGSGADGDASGHVDADDLTHWQDRFSESTNGAPPASLAVESTPAAAPAFVSTLEAATIRDLAAVDALYAAGDFTTIFAEARSLRPHKRLRLSR